MTILKRKRKKKPSRATKSVVGRSPFWLPSKFSLRQYGLVVSGLLMLAGGIALLAATPESVPSITITQGASRSLSPDFLGANIGQGTETVWSNPDLVPALNEIDPATLRGIIGGTPSNYFNWQTGQYFITSTAPNLSYINPSQPNPPFTLSTYVNALKASHANGMFNINVMTYCPVDNTNPQSTDQAAASCTQAQACGPSPSQYTTSCTNTDEPWGLDYQIAMLQTAQSMGVPIKYIELGNENYSTGLDEVYYFPTVQSYINKVNAWIPALKADFPGAQIAVVGQGSCQPLTTAAKAWDQAVASGVQGEDGITFHTYYANSIPAGSSVDNPTDLATLLSASTQNCASVLSNIAQTYLPSGVSAWVTEWNLWSGGTGVVLGSWAHGLLAANYVLDLARDPYVGLADNHDLVSTQVYGSLFSAASYSTTAEGGKTIGTPSPLPTTQPYGKTANGFALSALQRSMHGATSTTELDFSSNPDIAGTTVPGLTGQSFVVNGNTNLYFVNTSDSDETIDLSGLDGNYSELQYASDPTNFVTGDDSIPATTATVTSTVDIPAYSVTSLVATPPDTTPPTVSMSAPASGVTLSGTTTVSATATDNVGVASVQFQLDGANLGPAVTTPGSGGTYDYSWDTTGVANGAYTLSAVATDTSGNTTTASSIAITVNNSSSGGPGLTGDLNGDGVVNILDLSILLAHYDQNYAPAEFDGKSTVDIEDLSALLGNYGK